MLDSSQSRKRRERDGKEDFAGAWETRTIGSGLRGHSDDQIRPLKPDDRPETTKEYVRREIEEEDALTENKGDWGSRKGWDGTRKCLGAGREADPQVGCNCGL